MAIELKQQLKLTQQLVMTPQLQQAIKLLQLSRLELVDVVQQDLRENPVLEETEAEEELPAEIREDAEPPPPEVVEVREEGDPTGEAPEGDRLADLDWRTYAEAYSPPGTGVRPDDDRRSFEATLTRRPSLADHLDWQLQLSPCSEEERGAAGWIIGNLDEHGYFRSSVEEVARGAGLPVTLVEQALRRLQSLDPGGRGGGGAG